VRGRLLPMASAVVAGDAAGSVTTNRAPPPGAAATPEPAPYRDGASFEVWVRNLRETHSDVLFVAALEEIVARNVRSDRVVQNAAPQGY